MLVAFGFRLWFRDTVEGVHSLFFFPAIVLTAVLFDRGSGIVATLLSGALDVRMNDGELLELRVGDTASFVKGSASTWTVRESVVKFFVVSD